MKKLVSTNNLPHEEWLKYRKQGIGGSDAGAVCGLNQYRTAIHVYYDKTTDEIETFDNEAMRQGRDFEDYVAKRFMEETGKKVRRANAMFYDEKHLYMIADVDRMIVGENAGLEIKTASPYTSAQWQNGNIPLSYQMQCYHYMSVCNADAWYIAVLIYGREFKYYKLEYDKDIIDSLIKLEGDFWYNNVLKGVLPSPDGSALADNIIATRFKASKDKAIELLGFDEKLLRREELMGLIEKLETERKQIEQEVKIFMGEAESAENSKYHISWKSLVSSRLDTKMLQEREPEIYKKYLKQISSRRFMVKVV